MGDAIDIDTDFSIKFDKIPITKYLALESFFFHRLLSHMNTNNSIKRNHKNLRKVSQFCFHLSFHNFSFHQDSTLLELTRSVFPSVSYSSDILYKIYRQCNLSKIPCSNTIFNLNTELKPDVLQMLKQLFKYKFRDWT